jgi:hypothetical protein
MVSTGVWMEILAKRDTIEVFDMVTREAKDFDSRKASGM